MEVQSKAKELKIWLSSLYSIFGSKYLVRLIKDNILLKKKGGIVLIILISMKKYK